MHQFKCTVTYESEHFEFSITTGEKSSEMRLGKSATYSQPHEMRLIKVHFNKLKEKLIHSENTEPTSANKPNWPLSIVEPAVRPGELNLPDDLSPPLRLLEGDSVQ